LIWAKYTSPSITIVCCLLCPAHILEPFELEDMKPPYSPISQMVVDLLRVNSTLRELENSICNSFKALSHESFIHWDPILDERNNLVQDECGRSSEPFHDVFLSNWEVPI
jgi:hypothetical protein